MTPILFAATFAFAAEESTAGPAKLEWAPVESQLRYSLSSELALPPGPAGIHPMEAAGQPVRVKTKLDLDCEVERRMALRFECEVLDASVSTPHRGVQARRAAEGAQLALSGGRVRFEVSPSGRLTGVDLVTTGILPTISETLTHTILHRTLAGLDLELPGDVDGAHTWVQTRSAMLPESSVDGSLGRMRLEHHTRGETRGLVQIGTRGSIWRLKPTSGIESTERTQGEVVSQTIFDPNQGAMVFRTWTHDTLGTGLQDTGSLELVTEG